MSENAAGNVTCVSENGVATITFYHPSQNSLPALLLAEISYEIAKAGDDINVRIIVLKSAGDRTFCAGASFDELLEIKDKTAGAEFFSGFANLINAIRKSPKIVIARVQGKAVGGGVGLAAAADYCLATEAASIKLSELAIGIGPFVISPAVTRKIGLPAFSQLTIRASDFQTAQWAKEHSKELNIDSSRMIIVGDSVGGLMATAIAMMAQERGGPHFKLQVLFYPVTDANFDTPSLTKAVGRAVNLDHGRR